MIEIYLILGIILSTIFFILDLDCGAQTHNSEMLILPTTFGVLVLFTHFVIVAFCSDTKFSTCKINKHNHFISFYIILQILHM